MKRFLASSIAVKIAIAVAAVIALAYIVTHAAVPVGTGLSSPVMTNFNARYFTITLAAGTTPTNVIQLNLPMGPGSPDLPGDIINIVNGTNLWTNDLGNLRPRVVQTQLNASNIVSHESLTSEGAFDITSTYTGILTLGSNSVPVFQNSYILLSTDAASTDPTLRTVYLSGMASQGQLLFLENVLGNAGTTTSAFQLTNGTPCYDVPTMTVALQNGNWSSTNAGESLFLQFDGITGWREVSRFFGPLGGSGNSLWTNDAGILHPKDLTLPVMITNQFQFGPGTTNVLYRSGTGLVYTNGATDVRFTVLDTNAVGVSLISQSASSVGVQSVGSPTVLFLRNTSDQAALVTGEWRPSTDVSLSLGNVTDPRWANVVGTNLYSVSFVDHATNYSRLSIYQPNTNSPFIFDQQTAESAGYSRGFSFRTNGVEVFNVTGTGGPSSGANWVASGATNSTLAGTATATNGYVLGATSPPFSLASYDATFSGVADHVAHWGYNLVPGTSTTRVDPLQPLLKFSLEGNYYDGVDTNVEFNLDYTSINGLTNIRPMYVVINESTGNTLVKHFVTTFSLGDAATGTGSFFNADTTHTVIDYGAAPANNQFAIKANGLGELGLLAYSADNVGVTLDSDLTSGLWIARNTSAAIIQKAYGLLMFNGDAGLTLNNSFSPTTIMTLNLTSHNVGIATNTPSEKLEVAGNIKASGTNTATVFQSGTVPGISTTWTNMISGVITQRITTIGGIVVTNLTL